MKRMMFLAALFVSALATNAASPQSNKGQDLKVYAAAVVKTPLAAIAAEYLHASRDAFAGPFPKEFALAADFSL